jgi:hypothetical protein
MSELSIYQRMRAAYEALAELGVVPPLGKRGWKKGVPRTLNPEERKERRRLRDIERKALARRAAGKPIRPGRSQDDIKPWLAEGISRAKWYRRKKQERKS